MYKTYIILSMNLLLIDILRTDVQVWNTLSATKLENTIWMQFEMEIINYPV